MMAARRRDGRRAGRHQPARDSSGAHGARSGGQTGDGTGRNGGGVPTHHSRAGREALEAGAALSGGRAGPAGHGTRTCTSNKSARHAGRGAERDIGLADLCRKRQRQLRTPVPRAPASAAMSQIASRALHIAEKRESGAEQRGEKRRKQESHVAETSLCLRLRRRELRAELRRRIVRRIMRGRASCK